MIVARDPIGVILDPILAPINDDKLDANLKLSSAIIVLL